VEPAWWSGRCAALGVAEQLREHRRASEAWRRGRSAWSVLDRHGERGNARAAAAVARGGRRR
jgi:hypothetical protein